VVAVANENVLFCHELAFEDRPSFYAALRRLLPEVEIIEVPAAAVSLGDAIKSYMFNAQLVTLPHGGMGLIVPEEARETPSVWRWLEEMASGNGPIRELFVVDVRQSMANGGGPACLRLRVVADPEAVDPRFIADQRKLDEVSEIIEEHWPDRIAPDDLTNPELWEQLESAREALLDGLELADLA
jgi:succinylarginine dihydrolase